MDFFMFLDELDSKLGVKAFERECVFSCGMLCGKWIFPFDRFDTDYVCR